MNQGKLEVVKQEMARVNVDILGIGELRWTGMGEFFFCFFFFCCLFLFIFFKFYFIFRLYITVLVLPNIKMNPPQVYMCSTQMTIISTTAGRNPSEEME